MGRICWCGRSLTGKPLSSIRRKILLFPSSTAKIYWLLTAAAADSRVRRDTIDAFWWIKPDLKAYRPLLCLRSDFIHDSFCPSLWNDVMIFSVQVPRHGGRVGRTGHDCRESKSSSKSAGAPGMGITHSFTGHPTGLMVNIDRSCDGVVRPTPVVKWTSDTSSTPFSAFFPHPIR